MLGLPRASFEVAASLGRHRRLVLDFVRRDMRSRYAGASLGLFWSVLFPIVNLVVYMFVFRIVLKARWGDTMGAQEVALLMLGGIVIWGAFAETLGRTAVSMHENANLIQKVIFPAEVLPAFLSISSLLQMCFGLPVVLLGVYAIGHFSDGYLDQRAFDLAAGREVGPALGFGWSLVLLPLLLAAQFVFSTGIGFLMATLNVLLRDVQHVIGVGTMVWMFGTPIFYPAQAVRQEGYGLILDLNPMYWLIDSYREVLLYGVWPDWSLLLRFLVVAPLVFAVGAYVLNKHKRRFPDLL